MLVLSRRVGERIVIGGQVTVVIQRISRGRVSLAIEAPRNVNVMRGELTPFETGDVVELGEAVPADAIMDASSTPAAVAVETANPAECPSVAAPPVRVREPVPTGIGGRNRALEATRMMRRGLRIPGAVSRVAK